MAFPTIPTVAAGRVLTRNQEDTSATRTFPDLSGLTKNSGDLLIAIVFAYQASGTSASFGSWGAGFTEFGDFGTSGSTVAIGCAYKWSTGSETGVFTVTQAGTPTGFAAMILLSITGVHASTAPEAGGFATGTSTAANAGSLNPAGWGTEDTLWIAANANGETASGGTWTANNSAPTNYTDYVGTNPTDSSTVGQVAGAVAFRQLNAASEDPGAFSQDVSNARSGAILIAVRPGVPVVTGAVVTPFTFETITNGVDTRFGAVVLPPAVGIVTAGYVPSRLQVSWAALETPAAVPTEFGQVVSPFTFGGTTSGFVEAKGQVAIAETATIVTQATRTRFGATANPFTFSVVTSGTAETPHNDWFGAVVSPFTVALVTAGTRTRLAATASPFAFTAVTSGLVDAKGAVSLPVTVAETVSAWVQAFSKVDTPITLGLITQGSVAGTQVGTVVTPLAFGAVTSGFVTAKGALVTPLQLQPVVSATRTAFGVTATPITVSIVAQGTLAGQVFGSVVSPFTLGRVVSGTLTARGAIVTPITLGEVVGGATGRFGQVVLQVSVGRTVQGIAAKTASVVLSLSANETTTGHLTALGRVSLPLTWLSDSVGTATLLGHPDPLPVVVVVGTDGVANFVMLLDPIHTGRLGGTLTGGLAGAESGAVGDTVAGVIQDVLEEVPA